MKLYEMAAHMEILAGMLETGAAVEDTLESLEGTFEDKIENCMKMYRNLIGQRDMCKAEAHRLNERAQAHEKQAEALKRYVEDCMKRAGKDKMKTPLFTLWIQNNPEAVEITEESHIPQHFWRQPPAVVDKQGIKEVLSKGLPVPGAQLKQSQSLRVR